ncbi:MAG: hypothetical protein ACE5KG_05980, partial [Nitrososphaerales archaeon]
VEPLPTPVALNKTMNRKIITRLASTLEDLDTIGSRTKSLKSKESISLLYLNVMEIFNEYQKADSDAYRSLVREGGQISPTDLNALIDLDAELSLGINTLALKVSDNAKTGGLRKSTCDNMALGVKEIRADIMKRIAMISKQRIHNKSQIY